MGWWTDVDLGIILYCGLYRPVTLVLDLEVKRQGIVQDSNVQNACLLFSPEGPSVGNQYKLMVLEVWGIGAIDRQPLERGYGAGGDRQGTERGGGGVGHTQ
jgi:hypothetical protein